MKALVYTAPHEVQYLDVQDPTVKEGDVLIKIHAACICGSDMHAFHGHDPRRNPGLVLGHELSGEIVETKSSLYKVGDRVTVNPLLTCGVCRNCLQGRDNICLNRTMIGMLQTQGAYAQYISIRADRCIPLGDKISYRDASLTEPAANTIHALDLSMKVMHRPLPEMKALIIGGGAIGMLFALLMRSYGCRDITLAETNDLRRANLAKHLDCKLVNPITDTIEENAYDYAIDAVGLAATRNLAIASLGQGSVFMHLGLQDWSSEIDMRKITLSEMKVLGHYCYTHADLHATVKAIEEGVFGSLDWVSEMPMSAGPQAFNDLSDGKIASPKVVLRPWD